MSGAETNATNIEDDLNFVRTQLRILNGQTNWYDAPSDSFNIKSIHDKSLIYFVQNYTDITVPAGQNWKVLSGAEKPSYNIAIAVSALGAIVAQLAGSVGSHSTQAAANNGNLCQVRDAATNMPISTSGGNTIYALLQVGNLATDGAAFSDAGNDRGQISFVYIDPITETFVAVSVADIEGKVIEYSYKRRINFYGLPENAFAPDTPGGGGGDGGANLKKATRVLVAPISANTSINISTFTNPDSMTFGSDSSKWVSHYEVYINGILTLSGIDAAANNDVYYVNSTNFAFEYDLEINDIIQIIQRKV